MRLFTATEYAAVTIAASGELRGCRMVWRHKQLTVTRTAELPPDNRELSERLQEIFRKLEISRDHILLIGAAPVAGFFFECRTAALPHRELVSALEFEVQQQVLQLPVDYRLQYMAHPLPDGDLQVRVWVFPAEALAELFKALTKLHRQVDDFVYPMLALPPLSPEARVRLPELNPEFYWQQGSWHPENGGSYNQELLQTLKQESTFQVPGDADTLRQKFLTPLLLGHFAGTPEFHRRRGGLAVLPDGLRPRRHRSQLRIAIVLGALFLCGLAFSGIQEIVRFNRQYQQVKRETDSIKQRSLSLQKQLRARDKELKEMIRVNELNFGQHQLLSHLGRLSEALPSQVLVTNMRWNETGVDLTMQTAQENVDLASALRKLPMFKAANLQYRQLNDTIMVITLKLTPIREGKK